MHIVMWFAYVSKYITSRNAFQGGMFCCVCDLNCRRLMVWFWYVQTL